MHKPNRYLSVLFFILALALLSACTAGNENLPASPTLPAGVTNARPQAFGEQRYQNANPAGQQIRFWHPYSGSREDALVEIVEEFNRTNEWKIEVILEAQGDYGDLFYKTQAAINTADAPDLVMAYQDQAGAYQTANFLVDINTLVASPGYGLAADEQTDFFAGMYQQDVFPNFGGQRLGFPVGRSAQVLYYNADWLKELGYNTPPANPEQFKEMACKAAAQPFSQFAAESGSVGYELNLDASAFASWTFAFGGDVFEYTTARYAYNSEAAVAAMTFLQDLFASGCAGYPVKGYADQADFGDGKLLFYIGSSSSLRFVKKAIDAGTPFEWAVVPVPSLLEPAPVNLLGASVSIARSVPERELAAWLFVKYYTSPEVNARWAVAADNFPVRKHSAESLADYFGENPAYASVFNVLANGKFEPSTPGYDLVRDKVAEAMSAIVEGADVKVSLDTLNIVANTILEENMATVPAFNATTGP